MRRGFSGSVEDFDKKSLFLFEECLGRALRAKCMFELDAKAAKVKAKPDGKICVKMLEISAYSCAEYSVKVRVNLPQNGRGGSN